MNHLDNPRFKCCLRQIPLLGRVSILDWSGGTTGPSGLVRFCFGYISTRYLGIYILLLSFTTMHIPDSSRAPYNGSTRCLVTSIDIGTTFTAASFCLLQPGQVPKFEEVSWVAFATRDHILTSLRHIDPTVAQAGPHLTILYRILSLICCTDHSGCQSSLGHLIRQGRAPTGFWG